MEEHPTEPGLSAHDAFIAEMDKFTQGESFKGYNWLSAKRVYFIPTSNPDNKSGKPLIGFGLGEEEKEGAGILLLSLDELPEASRERLIQTLEALRPGRMEHKNREPLDQIKENAISARVTDLEALIQRGSIDSKRLNRGHIFALVTQNLNPNGITRADVEEWMIANRPDIL